MTRQLDNNELVELEQRKERAYSTHGAGIKGLQQSTAVTGDSIDLTRFIASRYTKKAFDYGWKQAVNTNQNKDEKLDDPRASVRKWAMGLGAIGGLIAGGVVAAVALVGAPFTLPAAIGIGVAAAAGGAAIGTLAGAFDGFVENRTLKGAIESGKGAAEQNMSDIAKNTDHRKENQSLKDRLNMLEKLLTQQKLPSSPEHSNKSKPSFASRNYEPQQAHGRG